MKLLDDLVFAPPLPGSPCGTQRHRGRLEPCGAGHLRHATRVVDIADTLVAHAFTMLVFEESQITGDVRCAGRDPVSYVLTNYGRIDPTETAHMLSVLRTGNPAEQVVLDFGAHVGWYTILAALLGYRVAAFECDFEHADLLRANVDENNLDHLVRVIETHVDAQSPALHADAEEVLFLKADVEGGEPEIVAMCQALLDARRVVHLQLEVSPVFRDGYLEMLLGVMDRGYDLVNVEDSKLRPVPRGEVPALVRSLPQTNVLLHRRP